MKSLGMRSDSDEAGPQIVDLSFDRRKPPGADVAVAEVAAGVVGRSRTEYVHIRLDYCKYIVNFNVGTCRIRCELSSVNRRGITSY